MRVDSLPESILSRCLGEMNYAANRWVVKKTLEKNIVAQFHFKQAMENLEIAISEIEKHDIQLITKQTNNREG